MQYRIGGDRVPEEEFLEAHADLLREEEWIIDGYGSAASAWERFGVADTLVYIDLPLRTHYWWVTKRLIQGLFVNPGLAGKQPAVEQHHELLQGRLVLPSRADAELQTACRRGGGFEAGSPLEVKSRDDGLPRCSQTRVRERVTSSSRAHHLHRQPLRRERGLFLSSTSTLTS